MLYVMVKCNLPVLCLQRERERGETRRLSHHSWNLHSSIKNMKIESLIWSVFITKMNMLSILLNSKHHKPNVLLVYLVFFTISSGSETSQKVAILSEGNFSPFSFGYVLHILVKLYKRFMFLCHFLNKHIKRYNKKNWLCFCMHHFNLNAI